MSKEWKITISLITLILVVLTTMTIKFFMFASDFKVSQMDMPNEKEVKETLYEELRQRDGRDFKEEEFVVTKNNDFTGEYGEHKWIVTTQEGLEFEVGMSNEDDYIWSDFGEVYMEHLLKEVYIGKTDADLTKEYPYGEGVMVNVFADGADGLYVDMDTLLTEKAKENNQTTQEYIIENKDALIEKYGSVYMVIDVSQHGEFENLKNIKEEEKNRYYESYTDIMKLNEELNISIIFETFVEDEFEEKVIKKKGEKTKTLTKEEFYKLFEEEKKEEKEKHSAN